MTIMAVLPCRTFRSAHDLHQELSHAGSFSEEPRMALSRVTFDVPLCGIVACCTELLALSDLHLTQDPRHQIASPLPVPCG
jgi:hypothetical protein